MTTCRLPESVGGLSILTHDSWNPEIFGNEFYIPKDVEATHLLLNGEQMLLKLSKDGRYRRLSNSIFLIGIDDHNPFVTRMSSKRYQEFLKNGEKAFYRSLIPKSISLMFEYTSNPILRQGDVWAIKVADDFGDILDGILCFPLAPNQERFTTDKKVLYYSTYSEPLMESRHEIRGDIIKNIFVVTSRTRRGDIKTISLFLGRGAIKAPDHPDLVIDDGVYVVDRTGGQNEMCFGTD